MGYHKTALATGCFYHVFNKSIAEFMILRSRGEYLRMLETIRFYKTAIAGRSFSTAVKLEKTHDPEYHGELRVRILAYCLMPTHMHFFVEQKARDGVSEFMRLLSHSYGYYLNKKIRRKGPLWESRFQAKPVDSDEYALHLSRYIHLNPTSAGLVANPEDWEFSSYLEYLQTPNGDPLCDWTGVFDLSPDFYRTFCEEREGYQRSLQMIKSCLLD